MPLAPAALGAEVTPTPIRTRSTTRGGQGPVLDGWERARRGEKWAEPPGLAGRGAGYVVQYHTVGGPRGPGGVGVRSEAEDLRRRIYRWMDLAHDAEPPPQADGDPLPPGSPLPRGRFASEQAPPPASVARGEAARGGSFRGLGLSPVSRAAPAIGYARRLEMETSGDPGGAERTPVGAGGTAVARGTPLSTPAVLGGPSLDPSKSRGRSLRAAIQRMGVGASPSAVPAGAFSAPPRAGAEDVTKSPTSPFLARRRSSSRLLAGVPSPDAKAAAGAPSKPSPQAAGSFRVNEAQLLRNARRSNQGGLASPRQNRPREGPRPGSPSATWATRKCQRGQLSPELGARESPQQPPGRDGGIFGGDASRDSQQRVSSPPVPDKPEARKLVAEPGRGPVADARGAYQSAGRATAGSAPVTALASVNGGQRSPDLPPALSSGGAGVCANARRSASLGPAVPGSTGGTLSADAPHRPVLRTTREGAAAAPRTLSLPPQLTAPKMDTSTGRKTRLISSIRESYRKGPPPPGKRTGGAPGSESGSRGSASPAPRSPDSPATPLHAGSIAISATPRSGRNHSPRTPATPAIVNISAAATPPVSTGKALGGEGSSESPSVGRMTLQQVANASTPELHAIFELQQARERILRGLASESPPSNIKPKALAHDLARGTSARALVQGGKRVQAVPSIAQGRSLEDDRERKSPLGRVADRRQAGSRTPSPGKRSTLVPLEKPGAELPAAGGGSRASPRAGGADARSASLEAKTSSPGGKVGQVGSGDRRRLKGQLTAGGRHSPSDEEGMEGILGMAFAEDASNAIATLVRHVGIAVEDCREVAFEAEGLLMAVPMQRQAQGPKTQGLGGESGESLRSRNLQHETELQPIRDIVRLLSEIQTTLSKAEIELVGAREAPALDQDTATRLLKRHELTLYEALEEIENARDSLVDMAEGWGDVGLVTTDGRIESVAPDRGVRPMELDQARKPGRMTFLRCVRGPMRAIEAFVRCTSLPSPRNMPQNPQLASCPAQEGPGNHEALGELLAEEGDSDLLCAAGGNPVGRRRGGGSRGCPASPADQRLGGLRAVHHRALAGGAVPLPRWWAVLAQRVRRLWSGRICAHGAWQRGIWCPGLPRGGPRKARGRIPGSRGGGPPDPLWESRCAGPP